jgi:hypothetical protein
MMNKYILMSSIFLLAGCSVFTPKEVVVTEQVFTEKVPLNLPMPKPVNWVDFEFLVVTPENYEDVIKKLREGGKSVALFAVDEESYKNLSLVVNDMKRYIGEQRIIIIEYKEYYENNK